MTPGPSRKPPRILTIVTMVSLLGVALEYASIPTQGAGERTQLTQGGATAPGARSGSEAASPQRGGKRREPPSSPKPPPVDHDATLLLRTEGAGSTETTSGDATPAGAAAIPTALQHAQAAKVSRCAPLIGQATLFTSGAQSATLSQWSSDRPDDHMFQALIGLGASAPASTNSAVVVIASPERGGCDATVVQVRPVAQSCAEIAGSLQQTGASLTNLSGMAVVQGAGTVREMLVPVPGSGCVIVGTGLALNK